MSVAVHLLQIPSVGYPILLRRLRNACDIMKLSCIVILRSAYKIMNHLFETKSLK